MSATGRVFRTLVLGGGGTRAVTFVGGLRALEERQLVSGITRVIGTSMGAVVGSLVAICMNTAQIRRVLPQLFDPWELLLNQVSLDNLARRGSVGTYEGFERIYKRWLLEHVGYDNITLSEVQQCFGIEFCAVAYDDCENCLVFLSPRTHPDLELWRAVYCSMALPFLLAPMEVRGLDGHTNTCVDGGTVYNFPLPEALEEDTVAFHSPGPTTPIAAPGRECNIMARGFQHYMQLSTLTNRGEFTCRLGSRSIRATVVLLKSHITSTLQLGLSDADLDAAIEDGRRATADVLDGRVSHATCLRGLDYLLAPKDLMAQLAGLEAEAETEANKQPQ